MGILGSINAAESVSYRNITPTKLHPSNSGRNSYNYNLQRPEGNRDSYKFKTLSTSTFCDTML